jgi:uncharacterized protein
MSVEPLKKMFALRWKPGRDLAVVLLSCALVVICLYAATVWVGVEVWGGMAYFFLYAVLGAALCGVGLPLYWMVVVRKRPLSELGITGRWLWLSLGLQILFAIWQYLATFAQGSLPDLPKLLPLLALSLAIGFFEALFWRGWVLLRLEEAFGLIPALLVGSALYAAYHIGYGMTAGEMIFLFFIGLLYGAAFLLTKNIFILWPVFQPMGQMVTLVKDGLDLPTIAALGFIEALAIMLALVWLAGRYARKHSSSTAVSPEVVLS